METPLLFVTGLLFALGIGYLAQTTGLCLVRGVSDWLEARRLRLIAILLSGFWIYLYLSFLPFTQAREQLTGYGFHWGFPLGGLIFGLGAAFNGACSISTASRLASGDLRMLLTMLGWLLGWLLAEYLNLRVEFPVQSYLSPWLCQTILAGLILASAWVYWRHRRRWRQWSGIMSVGILVGALFLIQPAWSPSDFVRDLGLSIVDANPAGLPALDRILFLLAMLVGMAYGARRYRLFQWRMPDGLGSLKYLFSGGLMGLGAALALGGNDYQLLLAMPALSLAGASALLGMLLGIWVGVRLLRRAVR